MTAEIAITFKVTAKNQVSMADLLKRLYLETQDLPALWVAYLREPDDDDGKSFVDKHGDIRIEVISWRVDKENA